MGGYQDNGANNGHQSNMPFTANLLYVKLPETISKDILNASE